MISLAFSFLILVPPSKDDSAVLAMKDLKHGTELLHQNKYKLSAAVKKRKLNQHKAGHSNSPLLHEENLQIYTCTVDFNIKKKNFA